MPLDEAVAKVFADKVAGILGTFRADRLSQRAMVVQLNALGIGVPNVSKLVAAPVQRVAIRLAAHEK